MVEDKEDQFITVPDTPITEKEPEKNTPEMPEKQPKSVEKPLYAYVNHTEWFGKLGWESNPFVFDINPYLLVGYENQIESILSALKEKQKISLVLGPTGSGKTSLLTWISNNLPDGYDFIFISKPPANDQELVDIFNNKFEIKWLPRFLRPFIPNIKNIHELPEFLNKKLKRKNLVVFFDECHEADTDILEWIRVLGDQVHNIQIILSALPVFEVQMSNNLETLRKRVMVRVEVLYLTKEEMHEMIKRRIENIGGEGVRPFTDGSVEEIYNKTGGFPRETIRVCNDLINRAAIEEKETIEAQMVDIKPTQEKGEITLSSLQNMTPLKRWIISFLTKQSASPGEMANNLDLTKYKSRQHAVRSMNNILKRMLSDGIVERERKDKAYIYHLSPKFRTLAVKS